MERCDFSSVMNIVHYIMGKRASVIIRTCQANCLQPLLTTTGANLFVLMKVQFAIPKIVIL